MNWHFFVALRYFNTRSRESFISVISLISVLGVAVGVAALIIVIAVMSGFNSELKERIIGTTPHIFIEKEGGINPSDPAVKKVLSETKEVTGSSAFVAGQVLLKYGDNFTGAILNGIDEDTEQRVTNIKKYVEGPAPVLGAGGILIGNELAREMGLKPGDEVSLVSAVSGKPQSFEVAGIFNTGLYSFDVNNAFVNLAAAQKLFDTKSAVTAVTVRIKDVLKADAVKKEIASKLRYPYFVRNWMDLNKNLFGALLLEKIVMFALLALIVLVACFNIASMLIMRVMEKTKDIGILKAIGASNADVMSVFRIEGFLVGLIGTILGSAAGLLIVWLQKAYKLIKLPSDVYYIDALPVSINWHEPAMIAVAAILLSLAATVYPSLQAARLEVVEALRYE
ncbi:MAG: ABC transporter permease [Candidatus Omnitrophica bacterium]|nr:ABC transporter permease [Candidatus Omnitrophota bacterium]MBU4488656.1 ABC transporter permease [Candidatus Omnitrophota bacterium]